MGVTLQRLEASTGVCVPQTDGLILTAAGDRLPVRAEGCRPDAISMALQDVEAVARSDIPHANGLIVTRAGKLTPIGMKC